MGAASLLVAALFLWFAAPGLGYYFTDDDVMNLRRAWPEPVGHFLRASILFSPDVYRPFGYLLYRGLFAMFGLHPLPFHLTRFSLLLFNLALLAWLTRRLTGSIETGLLAALIGCFHSRMDSLYLSTGTIFDIACYTLFIGGLVWYMRIRQQGSRPDLWQTAALLLMYVAALNSKEMAATWPVVLLTYEVLYHRGKQLWRCRVLWFSSAITVVFMFRKLSTASVLVQSYQPKYSLFRLLENWRAYLSALLYQNAEWNTTVVILLYVALLCVALYLRSKALQFSWLFMILTPLPVSFIETRGLYVWYIPLAGFAIYAAVLLSILMDSAGKRLRFIRFEAARPACFLLCAALLTWAHARDWPNRFRWNDGQNEQIRTYQRQVAALRPTMPRGARIVILDDPFQPNEWTPSSLIQLYYGDPTLDIHRRKLEPDAAARDARDIVFSYREGNVIEKGPLQRLLPNSSSAALNPAATF